VMELDMKQTGIVLLLLCVAVAGWTETITEVKPVNLKQSTGIYIRKGEPVSIEASGKWSLWDKYTLTGPEGHPFTANEYGNWGVLLGQIGSGETFVIGNGIEKTSEDEGLLYLFPNKGKFLIENQSGSLEVFIDGGTSLDDFITTIENQATKFTFDPMEGSLQTNLYIDEGDELTIYAFGSWTMWNGVYPEVNAEGHEFMAEGVPWGKLYGGIGSSFSQYVEIFPAGEITTFTASKSGLLSLFPYISNYVAVKKGSLDVYIIGGRQANTSDIERIDTAVRKNAESVALNRINELRRASELPELEINPFLSQSAYNHAKYMVVNDSFSRNQEEGNPEFTGRTLEERLKKVGYEGKARQMFCQTESPVFAVELFYNTVYHRLRLLNPDLRYFGYGGFKSTDQSIHVFDFGYAEEGSTEWEKVMYPPNGTPEVKVEWDGNESPDPFPVGTVKPLGSPVTLMLKEQIQKVTRAELVNDQGSLVNSYIITPDTDLNNKSFNAVIIVPKEILDDNTNYNVTIAAEVGPDRVPKEYTWSFTTEIKM
jgi:uncharacterized protein YkwD